MHIQVFDLETDMQTDRERKAVRAKKSGRGKEKTQFVVSHDLYISVLLSLFSFDSTTFLALLISCHIHFSHIKWMQTFSHDVYAHSYFLQIYLPIFFFLCVFVKRKNISKNEQEKCILNEIIWDDGIWLGITLVRWSFHITLPIICVSEYFIKSLDRNFIIIIISFDGKIPTQVAILVNDANHCIVFYSQKLQSFVFLCLCLR